MSVLSLSTRQPVRDKGQPKLPFTRTSNLEPTKLYRANQVLFASLLLPAGFAIAFGILLHQFLQTRKQLRTQPRFVPGKNPPIFFWQGAQIGRASCRER